MAGHRREPGVDLSRLADTDPVDCGLHVVEDPALGNAAKHTERLGQRVEQHLVGLQRISPHDERLAVRELGVRGLQLDSLTAKHRPVLAPVELEGFTSPEHQRHERAAPAGLGITLAVGLPAPHKRRHPAVGSFISQSDEVGVHLLGRALLLARLACLDPQPTRQLLGERVKLARPLGNLELRFNRIGAKVLADRVARQSAPPLNLPDRHLLTKTPAPDYAQ